MNLEKRVARLEYTHSADWRNSKPPAIVLVYGQQFDQADYKGMVVWVVSEKAKRLTERVIEGEGPAERPHLSVPVFVPERDS